MTAVPADAAAEASASRSGLCFLCFFLIAVCITGGWRSARPAASAADTAGSPLGMPVLVTDRHPDPLNDPTSKLTQPVQLSELLSML